VVAGTRQLSGVTGVTSNAIEHKLIVRYDPQVTSEAALIAAIAKVVDGVAR